MRRRRKNGFEKREEVAVFGYWDDKRWKEVGKLREQGKEIEANSLITSIQTSYGL